MGKDISKPLVILADDDDDDRELFQMALKGAGVQSDITAVSNGKQLMDYLKNAQLVRQCIIFLDINMPLKNGMECLEEIKANKKLEDIPVIMYSTSDHEDDIVAAFKRGANLYVPKPSQFKILIKLLMQIFSLNSQGALARPTKSSFVMSEKNISQWGTLG